MPEILTRHFGLVNCADDAVLLFPAGLPAFESAREFVLLELPQTSPVVFLQSVENTELCFLLLPVLLVDAAYRLELSDDDQRVLDLKIPDDPRIGAEVACYAVLSATGSGHVTANLLAPVVIHMASRIGVQAIRSDRQYSHQHELGLQGAFSCS